MQFCVFMHVCMYVRTYIRIYRSAETRLFYPTEVVVLEGILTLYCPEVRELLQMKLFVDLDSDTRLCRRGELSHTHGDQWRALLCVYPLTHYDSVAAVERDTKERGRDLDLVLLQYTERVKPAFEEFTLPVSSACSRTVFMRTCAPCRQLGEGLFLERSESCCALL